MGGKKKPKGVHQITAVKEGFDTFELGVLRHWKGGAKKNT